MNILVSNDDGINSNGLKTLVKALSELGDVYVVAPDSERSANSHHFTFKGKMRIEEKQIEGAKLAYALWGTPVDCIHAGLQFIIKEKIDLVVSGINKGWNISSDIIYSGTVAAAREGFMNGVKAIAVSLETRNDKDYDACALITKKIVEKYVSSNPSNEYFLNVNVPNLPLDKIKGIKVCNKEAHIKYIENYRYEEEFGVKYVTLDDADCTHDYDENDLGFDTSAVMQGYVSVSPLYNQHINKNYIEETSKYIDEIKLR